MKNAHHSSLKFHTIYSIGLAGVFVIMMLLLRDIAFGLAVTFLVLYVAGNGIIHSQKNELNRDSIVEYVLVAVVVLVLLLDILL